MTDPESPHKYRHRFVDLGREIAALIQPSDNSRDAVAIAECGKPTSDRSIVVLLSAILDRLDKLPSSIAKEILRAQRYEERAAHTRSINAEKQKQKTAAAELKAKEAEPPTITVIQSTNGQIANAFDNGRVLRRF